MCNGNNTVRELQKFLAISGAVQVEQREWYEEMGGISGAEVLDLVTECATAAVAMKCPLKTKSRRSSGRLRMTTRPIAKADVAAAGEIVIGIERAAGGVDPGAEAGRINAQLIQL